MHSMLLFLVMKPLQMMILAGSAARRAVIGAKLGIGYGNGKQFLYRLNHYGISRDAFEEAVNS